MQRRPVHLNGEARYTDNCKLVMKQIVIWAVKRNDRYKKQIFFKTKIVHAKGYRLFINALLLPQVMI